MTPPRPPTYADALVAHYRELRANGRLQPPDWLTERPSRRELRLLAVAVGLIGLQIVVAGAIWHRAAPPLPVAAPVVHRVVAPPRVIEPAKPRALNETHEPKVPFLFGSIVRTDNTWICEGPVKVGLVQVTMTAAMGSDRRNADAIHMRPGCTGQIGRIVITQSAGDGIKISEGVHDLTIYGGSIRCLAKGPTLHQDGVQVLGGARIRFENLRIDCGHPGAGGADLVNSNLFIRQAGKSVEPPTDVVCDHCSFGGGAAHTVSVQDSVRSGVTDSVLCPAVYSRQMLAVGRGAVDPVTTGNTIGACGGRKAGRPVRVVTHG